MSERFTVDTINSDQLDAMTEALQRSGAYLSEMHRAGRHDNLGPDFACSGCDISALIYAALGGFTGWLAEYVQVPTAIGDLARDADQDPDWPDGPDELQTYADHMQDIGCSQEALDTLHNAWARYIGERFPPPKQTPWGGA